MKNGKELKEKVREYWDKSACGTFLVDKEKYTLEYFEEHERIRYEMQPEIHAFAQFSRAWGKKVLEVGVGAGADFLQWVRSGAKAYGIDLTREAIEHVRHRLNLYGLKAVEFKVGDSENLPYPDDFFDIVYSWGVIHHTPNTEKAFEELVRVCAPGGKIKIMIYHRRSLLAYFFWIKRALLKGKPWRSVSRVLWEEMESVGTKAFTKKEVRKIISRMPVKEIYVKPVLSYYDRLERFGPFYRFVAKAAASALGCDRVGWELLIELEKKP